MWLRGHSQKHLERDPHSVSLKTAARASNSHALPPPRHLPIVAAAARRQVITLDRALGRPRRSTASSGTAPGEVDLISL
jgi:hypothetical protein